MPKVDKIEPKLPAFKRKKKVAAYARVSVATERLMHSIASQISYYSDLIQKNPDWVYAGVYADYAITGTETAHRNEFQRMLADAEAGRLDIILTKSISRFARNTVDLLETVRRLKEIGVEVRCEEQNISTFSGDGELMLSILASFAQEEVRSISENCKWGVRKRFQNGTIGRTNKHLFGLRYNDKTRQYEIIPEEAEIIRLMFKRYLEQIPLRKICDEINGMGHRGTMGGLFQESSLRSLLHNEVYAGDLLFQKAFVTDPITKKKVKNRGELPQYYMENAHEAIIDRETWALVQKEHERRNAAMPPLHCFTGKIRCAKCGMPYTRKSHPVHGKQYPIYWICRSKKETGMTCDNSNFEENELKRICAWALDTKEFNEEIFLQKVIGITVLDGGDLEFRLVGGKTKRWKNLHVNDTRPEFTVTDCFQNKVFCGTCGRIYRRVVSCGKWCYWHCVTKTYTYRGENCDAGNINDCVLRNVSAFMLGLEEFDEQIFTDGIERITVEEDGSLTYRFKDGKEETWRRI